MANNVVMRALPLTTDYQPLSDKNIDVATVDISAPPSNPGPVYFLGDDGSDVPWIPGEYHTLVRVNLSEIQVKSADPGAVITIVGGSW